MAFLYPWFFFLLLAALVAFRAVPPARRSLVLLFASCAFYLVEDPLHLPLLFCLTAWVYAVALRLGSGRGGRGRLALVATTALGLVAVLAAFKVAGTAFQAWRPTPGGSTLQAGMLLLAPLGMSYYVFKLIGYLLDVHWGRIEAEGSFFALVLYASFFPQILSGPIHRSGDFLGQLGGTKPGPAETSAALRRILLGLLKKFAIADRLGDLVATVHFDPSRFSSFELLLAAYAFAIQLYTDFSGLTDLALGLGQLFGIRGPENFDLPFFAPDLRQYWRRWHMSLTSWLADYLFTPLRLALRGAGRPGLVVAIVVNMVAVGAWHGASWTYVVFGAIHGVLLAASTLTARPRDSFFARHPALRRVRTVTGPLITFHLVVLALVVFRASSLSSAFSYLHHLLPLGAQAVAATRLDLGLLGATSHRLIFIALLFAAVEAIQWAGRREIWRSWFLQAAWPVRWTAYYAGAALVFFYWNGAAQKFIYAKF